MAKDAFVQSAIDNWAPRFINNGVNYSDFVRLTNTIERWEDWCPAWSACGAEYERMGEKAEAAGQYISAASQYFSAAMTYHFGKFVFVRQPQVWQEAHTHVVRDYQRALPYFDFPGERVAIPYEGETIMYGILRKPWHTPRPPIVILVPGLDSVKEELHNYGDDFLRRGMAVLAIDGPGQGEMEFSHALRADYEVPIKYTIDYLESRPDIDARRVGLMGVSLGGTFAARASAFEPRLQAVISNCGSYDFSAHFDRLPELTREAFVSRTKSTSEEEAKRKLQAFSLEGVMQHATRPLLVIMGRLDRLVPSVSAERMVAEAGGRAELWMFEDGNHVCNNIPTKHRPQQADWMHARLN